MLREVLDNNFYSEVESKKGLVVVDFWAAWCGPCRMLAPVVQELANDFAGKVEFLKLNVDNSQETAQKYRVTSIPTLIVFKDGAVAETLVGFRPKQELQKIVEKYL